MSTYDHNWTRPGVSGGGVGRQIAPAGGTLLAMLILLAVLPSAAAVSSAGADAAALATLVEAAQASRGEIVERGGDDTARVERRVEQRMSFAGEGADRLDGAGRDAWYSWAAQMAPRGLGPMPPPVV